MRCRVGDLAIVIRDDEFPQNVGAFLHVEGRATHEVYGRHLVDDWDCKPLQEVWGRIIDTGEGTHDMGNVGYPDDWLKPIRPERSQASAKNQEKELVS